MNCNHPYEELQVNTDGSTICLACGLTTLDPEVEDRLAEDWLTLTADLGDLNA